MKAKSITPLVALLTLLAWPLSIQADDSSSKPVKKGTIKLEMGEQKLMTFQNLSKISVGNPSVADVKPQGGDTFLLFATGAGRTSMIIYREKKTALRFEILVEDFVARKTVVLKHADGRALEMLLRPYLTKKGQVHYERQTRAITLVDEKPVVEVMLKMIERFDVKPSQIQFVLRLVEAEQAAKAGPVPVEIKPVVKQIKEVLRYNRFKVVDQAFLVIEANQESSIQVGGQNGYTVDLASQMVEGQKDSVRLKFHLYKKEKVVKSKDVVFVKNTLVATTVELKDGETAVLGASKINGSGKALITVVSMQLKK